MQGLRAVCRLLFAGRSGVGTAWSVLQNKVKKLDLLDLDRKALNVGEHFVDVYAHIVALDQPDGFA